MTQATSTPHSPTLTSEGAVTSADSSGVRGRGARVRRSTPLAARGEPIVWITGMAMSVCLVMIVSLLALVVVQGVRTFWPAPIHTVTLKNGSLLMGMPVRDEAYDANPPELAEIEKLRAAGELPADAMNAQGQPIRRLYRVGNKEFRQQSFEWVPLHAIKDVRLDPDAVLLERQSWGVWTGIPESVIQQRKVTLAKDAEIVAQGQDAQGRKIERTLASTALDGSKVVLERTVLASGAGLSEAFLGLHREAHARAGRVETIKRVEIGDVNRAIDDARLRHRQFEIDAARARGASGDRALPLGVWLVLVLGAGACVIVALVLARSALGSHTPAGSGTVRRMLPIAAWLLAIAFILPAAIRHPWSVRSVSAEQIDASKVALASTTKAMDAKYQTVLRTIQTLDAEDEQFRVVVRDPATNHFAPVRQTEVDEPLRISQVVRWVQPNQLGFLGKLGVYFDRWREFLLDDPREANTEGGIFPVIFGTVLLTLLLSVAVVPLGVIAALYMREYAKQGVMISIIRIAVNNLAGVPSIVYGVFGLGFFCYGIGKFIDAGSERPAGIGQWWWGVGAMLLAILFACWLSMSGTPTPGTIASRRQKMLMAAGVFAWVAAVLGALALVYTTPYFHGAFEARLPNPTFGTRGLLWGSLTLALLTLPVVIVATEEAIAAVPRTMREGSYGCGASKWQTITRIVLPRAMPGIMTGMILAMARGAGEVAPLMLVGAVKLAPELPISSHWPFIHVDRSFMHLGFHIYDVGFQSPDSEAARPIVWTTTLVLVLIVLLLNLTAIRVRAKLRRRFVGGAF